jgi:2-C-methyl-D-erythritol 4-phosphate cytidylyltransferase
MVGFPIHDSQFTTYRIAAMLTAIIVAGGSSQRMGFDKLLAPIDGKPVVAHSIAAFEQCNSVTDIILVARAERLSEYEEVSEGYGFRKISAVIPGGLRRQDSVSQGLGQLGHETQFVAVHDAARPLVTADLIERLCQLARHHGGAASAAPIVDTLKRVDQEHVVVGSVDRKNLFAVQTPQIFERVLLERAYREVFDAGLEVTDEISAIEHVGGKVILLPNESPNLKITYPADLQLAEFVLRQNAS